MGIYIPGMEMPKNCWECPFQEYGNCFANGDKPIDRNIIEDSRDGDCPLVPVPPHGRLIDADGEIGVNVTMIPGGKCRVDLIAPTIIPADTAEEGET